MYVRSLLLLTLFAEPLCIPFSLSTRLELSAALLQQRTLLPIFCLRVYLYLTAYGEITETLPARA